MTLNEALRRAIPQLRAAGVEDAPRDARILLAHAVGITTDRITLHLPDALDDAALARFDAALARRLQRQPVSHIVQQRLFWGLSIHITPEVLDPRPETEVLVAEALKHPFQRILDLGTGSGCILLACLSECSSATGVGVDASAAALLVAHFNAQRLGLTGRCAFVQSDWCENVTGQFDLIVSNPPYIAADEMAGLAPEVRDWEPHMALTPGGDGLDAYRAIARQSPPLLLPQGRLILEIGPTQGAQVHGLLRAQGFEQIIIHPDLDGRDRIVSAVKPG